MILECCAAWVVGIVGAAGGLADPPEVFTPLPFSEARAKAEADGLYLVVAVTNSWCEPCRRMDEETWADPGVAAWLKDKALAVRVDADVDPRTAAELGAHPPVVTVRRQGRELDRAVGFIDGPALAAWLVEVEHGRRAVDRYRAAAGDRDAPDADPAAHLDLARALLLAGEYPEAADEFAWLWVNMLRLKPAMAAEREVMVGDLARLVREHPPAADRFALLRDAQEDQLKTGRFARQALLDWISLNRALGENERTLEWIDRAAANDRGRLALLGLFPAVRELLYSSGRWRLAGELIPEPKDLLRSIERAQATRTAPPEADEAAVRAYEEQNRRVLRREAARLYAGALAADKETDATEVLWYAMLRFGDTALKREMVETALAAGEPRKEQLGWLKDEAELADLRARVEAALAAEAPK